MKNQTKKYHVTVRRILNYYYSDDPTYEIINYIIETTKSGIEEFILQMDLADHIDNYAILCNGTPKRMGKKWTTKLLNQ